MRGLSKSTEELIEYSRLLLELDHPQTLRQLHYAIFSRQEIDYANDKASYARLSRATTTARRSYREWELDGEIGTAPASSIPPNWMVDEGRQPETVNVWQDAASYIETVKRCYRRDNWQDQAHHVEVWSEKGSIMGAIRPLAEQWGVTLRVCHGFGSTGMEQQIGESFAGINKPITVYYLGDHDPSGRVIESDIHHRVETACGRDFTMERLAIHAADIKRFNLPPQRIKATDSRSAGFRREFGSDAATVELDALPAAELRQRVEEAITSLIDFMQWSRQLTVQEVEFACIANIAATIKALPQRGPHDDTRFACASSSSPTSGAGEVMARAGTGSERKFGTPSPDLRAWMNAQAGAGVTGYHREEGTPAIQPGLHDRQGQPGEGRRER